MGYDVEFSYHDKKYILINNGDGIIYVTDTPYDKRIFEDPMELLENFRIEDKTLLELSPEITNIEPV